MPVIRALVIVMLASAIAHADPKRVLVADPDAELVHAIEVTLQPWKMVVVAEPAIEPSLVSTRAVDADAQFIVWRDQNELVVYDRERDVTERRPARAGAMDPVGAASAALTVKTMMRLPDPPEETAPVPTTTTTTSVVTTAPVTTDDADVFRIEAGVGIDTEAALRAMFGATYRPTRFALRVGAAFELANQSIDQAGFKGEARDYAGLALATWPIPVRSFELTPWIGGGLMVDIVDGKHGQEMRHETAYVPTLRTGLAFWWWHSMGWGLGLTANASYGIGTPTYMRDPDKPTKAVIYDMPTFGATFALVAAWRR